MRPPPESLLIRLQRGAGVVLTLVLLAVAVRVLWTELSGYRFMPVPREGAVQPAVAPGSIALLERVLVARLRSGDVIEFRHPADPVQPAFLRVAAVGRSSESSGYVVRLESGASAAAPWHAELHGATWRVVYSRDPRLATHETVVLASSLGLLIAAGLAWRWYRVRPAAWHERTRVVPRERGPD